MELNQKSSNFSDLTCLFNNGLSLETSKLYKQIDGVAMGSPLCPTLANSFLCHYEKIWFDECPSQFKPVVYKRYVDDIFVLFKSKEHLKNFCQLHEFEIKEHKTYL